MNAVSVQYYITSGTTRVSSACQARGLQCCRFSRNIAEVTPKINYLYHPKNNLQDQSIQKRINMILRKTGGLSTQHLVSTNH